VLIVGAGPTGLMLANQLARRGVRPRIIDRHDGPAVETRALGVQARTLEIYARMKIVEKAISLGKPATGAQMWAVGKRRARVPLGDAGRDLSPYPYVLILGQDDNERLLGEALRTHGLDVEWRTELVGLSREADRVVARIRQPDGQVRETAVSWLAGCDGARSSVRELNRIEFEGAPYEHVFYVADTEMTGSMVPEEVNVYLWRGGFHLLFPMRGTDHWRVVGIVPPALRGKDDLTLEEVAPAIQREAGSTLSFRKTLWFSTYRIHHRCAVRFRQGRCFLLGDAAHIHSPVGAQGMNTGLQDAYNLAWKLALVATGKAGDSLLDSYEAERLPIARRLLATTDRLFMFIVSDTWLTGEIRTRVLPRILALAMSLEKIQRFAFRTISQTGIRYRESPISETAAGMPEDAPRSGDRFPWLRVRLSEGGPATDLFEEIDDTGFTLVLAGQPVPSSGLGGAGELVRTLVIPDDPENRRALEHRGIPKTAFYLVRPDGYIGLCGERLDPSALADYFTRRLGVRLAGG
jgi:2-polyprenyl-6-methoxyphenol hydroxylase-like FAD-dependent oxidoreductase